MKADPPVLEIDKVSIGYAPGTPPVVQDVTLSIPRGTTLGLVGESGSGKTTLSRAVVGLVKPSSGSLRLFGQDVATLDAKARHAIRRRVQMVFQDPYSSLNPTMRIADIIAEPLIVHRIGDRAGAAARARELLGLVGLDPALGGRYPAQLSGGQRQRVAIARALALSPDLIVCDEPVSALDVSVQAQILNLLKRLQRDLGLTLFFISHDLTVVRFIAQRLAVIEAGRIVEQGPCREIMAAPGHPYTRSLLEAARSRLRSRHADAPA